MGVKIIPPERDFYGDVMLGRVPGVQQLTVDGENPDFVAGGPIETVWPVGGLYVYPTAAATLAISSTDANDTLAGTGAQVVTVVGLDTNGDRIEETVDMNGVTPVNTVNSYLRQNLFFVSQWGVSGINEGEIDALHGVDILRRIEVGISRDRAAVFSIPNGKRAILLDQRWTLDDIGLVEATTVVQEIVSGGRTQAATVRFGAAGEGYSFAPRGHRFDVGPMNDVEAVAIVASKTGNPPTVTVGVAMGVHVYNV